MNYSDLKKKLPSSWTKIQLEQALKEYIGEEIEIDATISDIGDNIIKIGYHYYSDEGYCHFREDTYTKIDFSKDRHESELRSFQKKELVKIGAKLKNVSFGYDHVYSFEFLSIKKIAPLEKTIEISKEKDYQSLIYGCISMIFFTFSLYVLTTESENGHWFHDVGLLSAKILAGITLLSSILFIYCYMISLKEK